MRIDQVTKYRCDGCGIEQQNPAGWASVSAMMAGQMTLLAGGSAKGEDYCSSCIQLMRETAKARRS